MLLLAVGTALYAQTGTSEAWATNGSKRMEYRQVKALETSTKASTRITLDPEQTYQTVDGFGWMLNQGSAKLLMQLPADKRRATLEELFGADGLRGQPSCLSCRRFWLSTPRLKCLLAHGPHPLG